MVIREKDEVQKKFFLCNYGSFVRLDYGLVRNSQKKSIQVLLTDERDVKIERK